MNPVRRMRNERIRRRWFNTVADARRYAEGLAKRCGILGFQSWYDGGAEDRRCKYREWTVKGYVIDQHNKLVAIYKS